MLTYEIFATHKAYIGDQLAGTMCQARQGVLIDRIMLALTQGSEDTILGRGGGGEKKGKKCKGAEFHDEEQERSCNGS